MAYTENKLSKISALGINATETNLGANATFTGISEDVSDFASIKILIRSSHVSALEGFGMQFSHNGTTWFSTDTYTIPANISKTFSISVNAQFFRIVYTNGPTATSTFFIETIYHVSGKQASSQKPSDNRNNDNDAEETISYNSCYDATTDSWSRMRGVGGILQTINFSERLSSSGKYMHSSFRVQGNATANQNLFSIENPIGSGKRIGIERMTITNESTGVLTSVAPSIKTSRTTGLPTGGNISSVVKFDNDQANAVAIIRNPNTSDGGALTNINATAAQTVWTQFVDRLHTAVGQVVHNDNSLLPALVETHPFVLAPGEGLMIQSNLANAATTHFVINIVWEEYT